MLVPSEIAIYGVYFSPYLLAGILGIGSAWFATWLLNRYRISRFFFYPPLVFLALSVIFAGFIGIFVIPA